MIESKFYLEVFISYWKLIFSELNRLGIGECEFTRLNDLAKLRDN
jgi:hypothetical protein